MSYLTIKNEAISEFEEKKSVFIGHVKRVYSENEAREHINTVRSKHKEARHNVYAYIIGENMGIQRYSDDGEPQGTAGIPVLEVIKRNKITDVVIVVTRYFGGILLGTGGLARAYSKAAALAVNEGAVVEKIKGCKLDIIIDYDMLGKLQYEFNQNMRHIEQIEYTDKVKVSTYCELNYVDTLKKLVEEVTNGKAEFNKENERYFLKLENKLYPI